LRYNDVGMKANFKTIAGESAAGLPVGADPLRWRGRRRQLPAREPDLITDSDEE
jgi:hypothetical protein